MRKNDRALVETMDESELREMMAAMIELLDDGDQDDAFGTEGWRHCLGWDD